jgi:hypothetical protein
MTSFTMNYRRLFRGLLAVRSECNFKEATPFLGVIRMRSTGGGTTQIQFGRL